MKVADLRTLCGTHSVASTGNKDVLVQRLDALRKPAQAEEQRAAAKAGAPAGPSIAARSGAATPECTVKQPGGWVFYYAACPL